MSKRQLVAVRIGHIEIAFSPGGISRDFRIKSPVLQMIPEGIHIRDVEDQPPPAGHRLTLFQIEDRRLGLFSKKRRETRVLSTIEELHAQNISVKPHRLRHVHDPKSDRGDFFNSRRHARSLPRRRLNVLPNRHSLNLIGGRGQWPLSLPNPASGPTTPPASMPVP